jgi:hypothetical protein
MLMLVVRGSSLAIAVGTLVPIATGAMADPAFVIPDMVLVAMLAIGSLLPMKGARIVLTGANAYALGILGVAAVTGLSRVGGASLTVVFAAVAAGLNLVLIGLNRRPPRVL